MSPEERKQFDRLLKQVMRNLPDQVLQLIDSVPIVVEDYPSSDVVREMGLESRDELCGMFRGVPISEPELESARQHSDQVLLFREGVIAAAADDQGQVTNDELIRQIRITILHEYGHHFGLDEDELGELGYG